MKKELLLGGLVVLFGCCTLAAQVPITSRLPLIFLETNGLPIPNEPKMTAQMKVIDNGPGQINRTTDPPNAYDGYIGIEVRGATSAYMPQTPYSIETRFVDGSENNVSLFGMPKESDWCLISNYNDKAFARNIIAYQLARDMGQYAARTQLVEVWLDSQYKGIYLFCERLKRDPNRIQIAKADFDATEGDKLTGGYIFKVDYWTNFDSWESDYLVSTGPVRFVQYYPKPADLSWAQTSYLKEQVASAEDALYGPQYTDSTAGYRAYFDTRSFIDYFIVNEVARNADGSRKSRFFYKNRDSTDPLIHAGPVWDFDWAWKNIDECTLYAAMDGSGWSYRVNECNLDNNAPDWYARMLEDTTFAQELCARYAYLRNNNLLSASRLTAQVDSIADLVKEAQKRHYQIWPTLSYNNWTPEVNFQPTTFEGEVTKLNNWINTRLTWLDAHIPDLCSPPPPPSVFSRIKVYPNPATAIVHWNGYRKDGVQLIVSDALGRTWLEPLQTFSPNEYTFDVSDWPSGVYMVQALGDSAEAVRLVVF